MKPLLTVTAVVEAGAGLALLMIPSATVVLLVGAPLETAAALTVHAFVGWATRAGCRVLCSARRLAKSRRARFGHRNVGLQRWRRRRAGVCRHRNGLYRCRALAGCGSPRRDGRLVFGLPGWQPALICLTRRPVDPLARTEALTSVFWHAFLGGLAQASRNVLQLLPLPLLLGNSLTRVKPIHLPCKQIRKSSSVPDARQLLYCYNPGCS